MGEKANLQDLSLVKELCERDFELDDFLGIDLSDTLLSRMRLEVPPLSTPRELIYRILKDGHLRRDIAHDLGIMRVMAHQGRIQELLDQSMDIPYVLVFLLWGTEASVRPTWELSFAEQASQWQRLIRYNLEAGVINRGFLCSLDSYWKTLKAFIE